MVDLDAVRFVNPDYFISSGSKFNNYLEYHVLKGKISLKYFLVIGYKHLNLFSLFELDKRAVIVSDVPIDFETLHEIQEYLKRN